MIGRYGGEEFLIILPGSSLEDALSMAEYIRRQVEDIEIAIGENKIKTTISVGVASIVSDDDLINIMQVIKRADFALYEAKAHGRNRVCCA